MSEREITRSLLQERDTEMRSAAFTSKVTAFSRTLRLRGKKKKRIDTHKEKERVRWKDIKMCSDKLRKFKK